MANGCLAAALGIGNSLTAARPVGQTVAPATFVLEKLDTNVCQDSGQLPQVFAI